MKIGQHVRSAESLDAGIWVSPDMDHPEFEVRAKVRSPTYFRRNEKQMAAWARVYSSKGAPAELQHKFAAKLLFEECIAEFRGLTDNDGAPMTREAAEEVAGTFEGQPFFSLLLTAVIMAEARREVDAEEAEGNSPASSAGS